MADYTDILDIAGSLETTTYLDYPSADMVIDTAYSDGAGPPSADPSFNLVAFSPLNQGLAQTTDTTIVLDMSLTSGTLVPAQVIIQVDGVSVYSGGAFLGEYTTSSIIHQGGGVFRLTLIKDTPWSVGSSHEIRVYPPGESP